MNLSKQLLKLNRCISEEDASGGAVGDGMAGSGSGTVSDLGQPPVYGVTDKKKKKRKKTKTLLVTEDVDDDYSEIETEEEGEGDDEDYNNVVNDQDPFSDTEDVVDDKNQDYSDDEIESAKNVLDQSIEPESDIEDEEDTSYKPPKVRMSRVLKHKVFKRVKNTHARNQDSIQYDPWQNNNILSMHNRLNIASESFMSALFEKEENDPVDNNIVIGEVIKKDDRYVFAARVSLDNSHKDFIFEGNYEQMEALLTLLKAEMQDLPGKSSDIMNEVNARVSPVRIFIQMDSLMTDGIRYAKQIVTK